MHHINNINLEKMLPHGMHIAGLAVVQMLPHGMHIAGLAVVQMRYSRMCLNHHLLSSLLKLN